GRQGAAAPPAAAPPAPTASRSPAARNGPGYLAGASCARRRPSLLSLACWPVSSSCRQFPWCYRVGPQRLPIPCLRECVAAKITPDDDENKCALTPGQRPHVASNWLCELDLIRHPGSQDISNRPGDLLSRRPLPAVEMPSQELEDAPTVLLCRVPVEVDVGSALDEPQLLRVGSRVEQGPRLARRGATVLRAADHQDRRADTPDAIDRPEVSRPDPEASFERNREHGRKPLAHRPEPEAKPVHRRLSHIRIDRLQYQRVDVEGLPPQETGGAAERRADGADALSRDTSAQVPDRRSSAARLLVPERDALTRTLAVRLQV